MSHLHTRLSLLSCIADRADPAVSLLSYRQIAVPSSAFGCPRRHRKPPSPHETSAAGAHTLPTTALSLVDMVQSFRSTRQPKLLRLWHKQRRDLVHGFFFLRVSRVTQLDAEYTHTRFIPLVLDPLVFCLFLRHHPHFVSEVFDGSTSVIVFVVLLLGVFPN